MLGKYSLNSTEIYCCHFFLSGKQTFFIEHVSIILVIMIFWGQEIKYRENALPGVWAYWLCKERANLLSINGVTLERNQTMRFIRAHCLSALSRTQSWSQKALHGNVFRMVMTILNHPWWPGASSWPSVQQDPSPWPKAANHWPGTQSGVNQQQCWAKLRAMRSMTDSSLGRLSHSPSFSRVKEFRVLEIGWFP